MSEKLFETACEADLLAGGYVAVAAKGYDRERAVFPEEALTFIRTTQPEAWAKLETLHADKTGERVLHDLVKWLDTYGSLATLRHGFKCFGRTLRIAYFKAAHGLNPELEEQYQANRVGITRQLFFSTKNTKSLDITISVNGVPVATVELKNPLTGQSAEDAIKQYRKDRDPRERIFDFKKRTLVHFAADPDTVHMTTRLAESSTHFLPFNKGNNGGAGNPPDATGRSYKTAYLWEEVLQRDSLLDLLARFLHLQVEERFNEEGRKVKKETMIFPRYHQLQAVRQLVGQSAIEGPGHNYLVEHSAGSGKSNTIAWLAHRLSSLHNAANERVYDTVVVITDRRVLDKQLQDTIYQFEHRQGVVEKIDEDSKQLAEALRKGVPLVITTLQKFPFVGQQLLKLEEEEGMKGKGRLKTKRYAVVVDEAHSSQSGESATDLREVLGGEDLDEAARKRAEEEGSSADALFRSMAKRGKLKNLSFYAFTATPKHKTLKIFGRDGEASHKYTMRQAIEEGFILDVLKNYTSYKSFWKLLKACEEDPNVERKKAAKALGRFMRLHPHNIEQKTEIIIEHFMRYTRPKIGGRAKGMVVTGSRQEAVRYKLAFDEYIKEKGYDIKALVAFSGTVQDDKVKEKKYTEVEMNGGIKERELPDRFATGEYQVLLVAEKYQTGFDQPLLHTMYVDKRLAGIQAVQTLSRLNRTHPLKEDTFVLDFVNDREQIQAAFRQYYEGAEIGAEVEPSRLYEIKAELDERGIYLEQETKRFCEVFFAAKLRQSPGDHKAMNSVLDLAVERFKAFHKQNEDEAELWRGKLTAFRDLYAFLSQIIPYQDSDLERLYTYLRHLASKLPKRSSGPNYHFDDEVRLEYFRLQKIAEGSISLDEGKKYKLDGPSEVGSGIVREGPVPLSKLINTLNERFGTEFNEADQLFFDQLVEAATRVDSVEQAAKANPKDKFLLLFRQVLESLFIERMELNEEMFARFMNDAEFRNAIEQGLGQKVYERFPKALPYGKL